MRHLRTAVVTALAVSAVAAPAASAASPSVSSRSATSVGQSTAVLRGYVNPHGLATSYAFQYGATASYGAQTDNHSAGSGTSTRAVDLKVASLTPGTTYHFRLLATSADGTTAGSDRTFTTALPPAKPPAILATAPFAPSANAVTFTAILNPNAATTTYRFQYGTSTAYGVETFGKTLGASVSASQVTFTIGSLAPHTSYHFRVVASNRGGTTVGPDAVATTGPFPPGKLDVVTGPSTARRSHPYFVTRGAIQLGSGVSVAEGCGSGTINVSYTSGSRTVTRASQKLSPGHCSFRLRTKVNVPAGVTKLRVHTSFSGNAILTPFEAPSRLVAIH
ncbi:MAG: hypothetical protein JWQ48_1868 [Conexibacter sp.]|jgi:hypothetical protein|nr:hypothetical protein [Conexibacter sp.]